MSAKHTPTPWTKVGSAKRTLFTTAQGQHMVAPDKAFLPVEILTCLRGQEQAEADCDFVLRAVNSHAALVGLLSEAAEALGYLDEFYDDKVGGAVTPNNESPAELADRITAALALAVDA